MKCSYLHQTERYDREQWHVPNWTGCNNEALHTSIYISRIIRYRQWSYESFHISLELQVKSTSTKSTQSTSPSPPSPRHQVHPVRPVRIRHPPRKGSPPSPPSPPDERRDGPPMLPTRKREPSCQQTREGRTPSNTIPEGEGIHHRITESPSHNTRVTITPCHIHPIRYGKVQRERYNGRKEGVHSEAMVEDTGLLYFQFDHALNLAS